MTTDVAHGSVQFLQVQFDDLDAMGMVHNARYPLFLERALGAYWTQRGWSYDPRNSQFEDVFLAVRELTVTYETPIVGVGEIAVHFWIERLGRTSVVYGFSITSADRDVVHATGRRAQVRIDPATLRPAPISAALRDAAQPLLLAEPAH